MAGAQPAPQGLSYRATCITLVGIRAQVMGGKKREVNRLIPYPPGSFPLPGEGVVPLQEGCR